MGYFIIIRLNQIFIVLFYTKYLITIFSMNFTRERYQVRLRIRLHPQIRSGSDFE